MFNLRINNLARQNILYLEHTTSISIWNFLFKFSLTKSFDILHTHTHRLPHLCSRIQTNSIWWGAHTISIPPSPEQTQEALCHQYSLFSVCLNPTVRNGRYHGDRWIVTQVCSSPTICSLWHAYSVLVKLLDSSQSRYTHSLLFYFVEYLLM